MNSKTRGTAETWTKGGDVRAMPLAVRDRSNCLDARQLAAVRVRLARDLENVAWHIERVVARFEDVNGPRGGVDIVCRVSVLLRALPRVVVEKRATDPLVALGRAAAAAGRTVRRVLRRAGRSQPAIDASSDRAGYEAAAVRKPRRSTTRAAAALEDFHTTPTRKSKRTSAEGAKAGPLVERKAERQLPLRAGTRARARRDTRPRRRG